MTRDRRKERIARAAGARNQSQAPQRATFWCTRDSAAGQLLPVVDVWLSRPDRTVLADGSVRWSADVDGKNAHFASWDLATAEREVRTVPDDDRQCVRRGDEASAWVPRVSA